MSANRRAPLEQVAVFGGGMVALTAAVAIARALPSATVTLIRTPLDPAALADRLPATLPTTAPMLERLGLSEERLIANGAATHRLGESFQDWGEDKAEWTHGYGGVPPLPAPGAPYQHWLEARRRGVKLAYSALEPASALAAAERFAHPVADRRSLLSQLDYALRLDPDRAAALLAQVALSLGIQFRAGTIATVGRAGDGRCGEVRMVDGARIAADLFIDATGSAAPIAAAINAGFVDWGEFLPCDHLLLARAPGQVSPTDRYRAVDIGWRAIWPGAGTTLTGLAFREELTGEARARRVLGAADAELVTLWHGRRALPLNANVLALGDAAAATGALGWSGYALAQAQLNLFMDLLPGREPDALLNAEYNRRANLRADRMLDYVSAFYRIRPRRKGEFWAAVRGSPLPEGLAHSLDQFAQRGLVAHHEEETVTRDDWIALFLGLGVIPRRPDPVAMSAPSPLIDEALRQLARAHAALPAQLPGYAELLAQMTRRNA